MNWLCKFGLHKWGKWRDAIWSRKYFGELVPRTGDAQMRWCEKCGKWQRRKM